MLKFLTRSILLTTINFAFFWSCASAQQTAHQQITNYFDSARTIAPREKIYVHFDKTVYAQKDTLWFKTYLVNTTLNDYSTISGLVYTELINASGDVVNTLALPTILGLTWGSFALKETLFPPGKYTFRAYTKWMQNFGDTYIFSKEITIVGTELAESTIKRSNRRNPTPTDNANPTKPPRALDIQFLPEGGTWLQDAYQKMAFKALNINGKGTQITGDVIDSKERKVADIRSNRNGMGYFYITPQADESYTARINIGNTLLEKPLPKPKNIGTSLIVAVNGHPDSIAVTLYSTLENENLAIIGQSRGVLCFTAYLKAGAKRTTFKIAKDLFVTGVGQILVMNSKLQPLNERNFFLNFNDQLTIVASTLTESFTTRDSIPIQLKVVDKEGKPVEASLSIAITDDGQVAKNEKNDPNILTSLLLTSDLRGNIENPGQYFHRENPDRTADLDLLMLTQGWVSYAWPAGKQPSFKPEKEYTISGNVTNVMNKPSVGAKIVMLGKNKDFLMLDTITNNNGEFVLNQLPMLDSASFVIQALNAKGKRGTLGITLNEFVRPPIDKVVEQKDELPLPSDSTTLQFIAAKKQTEEAAIKSGIALREVKIVGKRSIKGSKNLNGPGEATQTLTDEQLAPLAKKTLYDVLVSKIKGFRSGTRKGSSIQDLFINFDLARFVIDGIELDFFYTPTGGSQFTDYYLFVKGYLDYYNAEDILGVETMENGLSWRYKSEFKNPMDLESYAYIEVTTKTGSGPFLKKAANMYLLKPINYGDAKTFYHPRYTTETKKNAFPDFRSTLYWNPNITTDQTGTAKISFFSADKKGTYTVWIEGTDMKGGLGMGTFKIEIK